MEQDSVHELFECSIEVLANIDSDSSVKVLRFSFCSELCVIGVEMYFHFFETLG